MTCPIEITLFESREAPLTKSIRLEAGVLVSEAGGYMSSGTATRLAVTTALDLVTVIKDLGSHQALGLGRLAFSIAATVEIHTSREVPAVGDCSVSGIRRIRDHISYAAGAPALMLIDVDYKGMPREIADRVNEAGGVWEILKSVCPMLGDATRVRRSSTSSGLSNQKTGEAFKASGGEHIYIWVTDGLDIQRALSDLHDRLWLNGFGWFSIGGSGQLLERSLVDRMVWSPERLIFEAPPILAAHLVQDHDARAPMATEGITIDTAAAVPGLTRAERTAVEQQKSAVKDRLRAESQKVRETVDRGLADKLAESSGIAPATCLRMVRKRHEGHLLPLCVLEFDDLNLGHVTVGEVLENPAAYIGHTLADPLEGISYGRGKALIMVGDDGWPFIHSFAHGRAVYRLKLDAKGVRSGIDKAEPRDAVDVFINLIGHAELEPDEEVQLRDHVCARSGSGKASINARVRSERARIRALVTERRARDEDEARVQLQAPARDAELTPVLRDLDATLSVVDDHIPPMRNVQGDLVTVRMKPLTGLRGITEQNEAGDLAPQEPLIDPLDTADATLQIERYVDYRCPNKGTSNRLHPPFVDAYRHWRDGILPTVRAVITAPIITQDGGVLSGHGLDRISGAFYSIDPRLQDALPADQIVSDEDALEAWRFLSREWLIDVQTDATGKAIAIAYALTLIERVLLPERPAFFVTAAQRGGGKTTLISMLTLAVLGREPAVAAWTTNDEERRKSLMAYFRSGVSAIVWDNIERAQAISCPRIESALTRSEYTDRVLGTPCSEVVSCQTVIAFTGNNILPRGDMASRSLVCRLSVDRPDPENRSFRHLDPIEWTSAHRLEILAMLYRLLLWRPAGYVSVGGETRFKTWWRMIGQPLELVTKVAGEPISFRQTFDTNETADDEADGVLRLYTILHRQFSSKKFTAVEIGALIETAFMDAEEAVAGLSTLRTALEEAAGSAFKGAINAQTIAKKFQPIVDRPCEVDGSIFTLKRDKDRNLGNRYHLVRSVTHLLE